MKYSEFPGCCGMGIFSGLSSWVRPFDTYDQSNLTKAKLAEKETYAVEYDNPTVCMITTVASQELDTLLSDNGWIANFKFTNRKSGNAVTVWVKPIQGDDIEFLR